MSNTQQRTGILCAGNFIVDTVKIIDSWPQQDTLCTILSQNRSNGGGPYNILKNLAKVDSDLPLEACGLVGDDSDGQWVLEDCRQNSISTELLKPKSGTTTSLTDAMSAKDTGRRTFFHNRGANAQLTEADINLDKSNAKIFYLGYLTLLDSLDIVDSNQTTGASRTLAHASEKGFISAVDCVSSSHPQFREIALASLRAADIFFVNEFELSSILGYEVTLANLETSIRDLADQGSRGTIVVHMPEVAISLNTTTNVIVYQQSINFPNKLIVGSTGAGDAFASGYLYAKHQDWSEQDSLKCAASVAAISLTHASPSDGVQSLSNCFELANHYGYREDIADYC